MSSFLCRWFGLGCPSKAPTPPVPTLPPTFNSYINCEPTSGVTATLWADDGTTYPGTGQQHITFSGIPTKIRGWGGQLTIACQGYTPRSLRVSLSDPVILNPDGTPVAVTLVPAMPPVPSREQVCGIKMTFQGLTINTTQFGSLPWFEVAVTALNPSDRQVLYQAKRQAGDTHLGIEIMWDYPEPGQPYGSGNLVPPVDMTGNLPAFKDLVKEIIQAGFFPMVFLSGDGQVTNPGAKGYAWLMENLVSILTTLKEGVDLTPYCLFVPGFDSVFYGWEPDQVVAFGKLFRSVLPNGHLGLEHDSGHIPLGEGGGDFLPGGRMQDFDVILSEMNGPPADDTVWQISGRLLGPNYLRPAEQPAGDDPTPPFYLAHPTIRGPWFVCAFEWVGLYNWVRGRQSAPEIDSYRQMLRRIGWPYTG